MSQMVLQRTLIILKPDCLERGLVGEVTRRFEEIGLRIVNMRFFREITSDLIQKHYPNDIAENLGRKAEKAGSRVENHRSKGLEILEWVREYVRRGPVIAIVFEGEDAVMKAREIAGYTDPDEAEKGTIRGDLGIDAVLTANKEGRAVENLVHIAGNVEDAEREIKLWFECA